VLDIDLDFFLERVAYWREADAGRLDPRDYPPWSREAAFAFLETQCKLTKKVPGFAVEHHGEVFSRWREAIDAGVLEPPFSVTHVDAHADLGLGDIGYVYVLTELVFEPVEARRFPRVGEVGFTDGNWLTFAVACGWVSDLTYVFNGKDGRPNDVMPYIMEGFDTRAEHIQLPALTPEELDKLPFSNPTVTHLEPKVPFETVPWPHFEAADSYDLICLARSPGFTPPESDELFDAMRERFIDEPP
jgi:hypothetical protein